MAEAARFAGLADGPVPDGVLAVRVPGAGVEAPAPLGAPLGQLAAAARLGARHPGGDRPDALALGVIGAGQELAELAALDLHRAAALVADLALGVLEVLLGVHGHGGLAVRVAGAGVELAEAAPLDDHGLAALRAGGVGLLLQRFLHLEAVGLGRLQVTGEGPVEILEGPDPLQLALLDLVQLALHVGGELDLENVGELLGKYLVDHHPQLGGLQRAALLGGVLPVDDGADDDGVGRGPADAGGLQGLDQAGLVEPRRRLGEMLLGQQLQQFQGLARLQLRQVLGLGVLVAVVLLHPVGRQEPVEGQPGAAGPEQEAPGPDVGRPHRVDGRGHLAGQKAAPDQAVELELVRGQEPPDALRRPVCGGGPDGLVTLLGALARPVVPGLRGQVFGAEMGRDEGPGRGRGLGGHAHRVGAHVGYQAHRPLVAQFDPLVQLLGHRHGLFGREPQAAVGRLLQGAGDERRIGMALLVPGVDAGDREGEAPQLGDDPAAGSLVPDGRLLVVDLGEGRLEGAVVAALEPGGQRPVLLGLEALDLPLALADQPQGHRLHPSGRQAAPHRLPQERAHLVAHQPVQDAAGLLGVDLLLVDPARMGDGLGHALLGDLVEHGPLDLPGLSALVLYLGGNVPGDGLALAVRVGGDEYPLGLGGGGLDLGQHLGLALDGDVGGLEVLLEVHPQLAGRQVADVPHGGDDRVLPPQVLADGPGLGRRFHDDELFGHDLFCSC